MGKKAKTKPGRKSNFPLVFKEGLRDRAEAVAEAKHGGNLTHLSNTAIEQYVDREEARAKKGK
jgi:hypothetical protein